MYVVGFEGRPFPSSGEGASFPFPPCVLPSALEPVDFSIHAVVAPFAFVSLVPHT
jgi:hypothetical protein